MTTGPALTAYFRQCHRRTYRANATIINAGEPSNVIYYLVSGSVSVLMEDEHGHEIVLAYLDEGDFFGEMGLFDELHERSAWVRARTRCEVAQLGYDRFRELLRTSPEAVFAIMSRLSRRVRDTSRKAGDLVFKDVTGRIARALLDLCQEGGAQPHPSGVQIRVTRQELGRIVGCSREMASRVLHGLEAQGAVRVSGKSILVLGAGKTKTAPATR